VNEHTERLRRLEQTLHAQVHTWRLQPVVEALQALRGVQFAVALTIIAELGDLTRVDNPRQLMSYLGLTPSEYSSGERRRQGSITKTGNTHARHALVEGAWAYRDPAKVSRHWQLRLEKLPKAVQGISWKAQVRLCTRYRQLSARGETRASSRGGYRQGTHRLYGGYRPRGPYGTLASPDRPGVEQQSSPSEGARPRYGATRDGVKSPAGTLAPRVRPAPDGPK
jgi:hypothetical protein